MLYIDLAVNILSTLRSVLPSSWTNIQWSWKSSASGYETKKSASIIWRNEHKNMISQATTKKGLHLTEKREKRKQTPAQTQYNYHLTICEILQSLPQKLDPPVVFVDIFIVHCGNITREKR